MAYAPFAWCSTGREPPLGEGAGATERAAEVRRPRREAEFFDDEIVHVCEVLALRGVRVIVAGLDMDYLGKPFGQMPYLLSIADYITKLHAICMKCGNIANISYRKTEQEGQVLIGEKETYEPRCRHCANEK